MKMFAKATRTSTRTDVPPDGVKCNVDRQLSGLLMAPSSEMPNCHRNSPILSLRMVSFCGTICLEADKQPAGIRDFPRLSTLLAKLFGSLLIATEGPIGISAGVGSLS